MRLNLQRSAEEVTVGSMFDLERASLGERFFSCGEFQDPFFFLPRVLLLQS